MSARANGGMKASEAAKPKPITAIARPRWTTNHCATMSVALIGVDPCPRARSAAKAMKNAMKPCANAIPKQATPSAPATKITTNRGPKRSDIRLTYATMSALTPVPTAYSAEIVVLDSPVSSMIESRKTENV